MAAIKDKVLMILNYCWLLKYKLTMCYTCKTRTFFLYVNMGCLADACFRWRTLTASSEASPGPDHTFGLRNGVILFLTPVHKYREWAVQTRG